jgi:hypothetical protein
MNDRGRPLHWDHFDLPARTTRYRPNASDAQPIKYFQRSCRDVLGETFFADSSLNNSGLIFASDSSKQNIFHEFFKVVRLFAAFSGQYDYIALEAALQRQADESFLSSVEGPAPGPEQS